LNLQARGLLLRRAVESKTGICPRTPFVVSRTREPRPTSHAHGECLGNPRTRAPIRLLPIRAPRQTVLRTSSWLAPSCHHQALRLEGAEDARCVQPTSATQTIACTRTSRVPGSLSQLSPRGRPTETKAPCGIAGGPGVSRRPKTASADRDRTRNSSSTASRPGDTSVGVFFPRCSSDRASDTPVAMIRSTSRLRHLRACCKLAVRPSFERVRTGRRMRTTPRPPLAPSRES
jgi:hypothetical protein